MHHLHIKNSNKGFIRYESYIKRQIFSQDIIQGISVERFSVLALRTGTFYITLDKVLSLTVLQWPLWETRTPTKPVS